MNRRLVIVVMAVFVVILPGAAYFFSASDQVEVGAGIDEIIKYALWRFWAAFIALYLLFMAVRDSGGDRLLPERFHNLANHILPAITSFRRLATWKKKLCYLAASFCTPVWEVYISYSINLNSSDRLSTAATHAAPLFAGIGILGALILLEHWMAD